VFSYYLCTFLRRHLIGEILMMCTCVCTTVSCVRYDTLPVQDLARRLEQEYIPLLQQELQNARLNAIQIMCVYSSSNTSFFFIIYYLFLYDKSTYTSIWHANTHTGHNIPAFQR